MTKLLLIGLFFSLSFTATAQLFPKMVSIEKGSFMMGNDSRDEGSNERPVHNLTIDAFYMSKYEITVAQYKAFCKAGKHPLPKSSQGDDNDNLPITNVRHYDATAYCKWLSKKTGKTYRLPTEAEWEYAARGGNKSMSYTYAGSEDVEDVGWCQDNAEGVVHECGKKKPNKSGLYDMSGNVWEWCSDWFSESYYRRSPVSNPIGPKSGDFRVLRGGSWNEPAHFCTVSTRYFQIPDSKNEFTGFRVIREIQKNRK